MSSYTTVQGDTWDRVAKRVYGSELLMHRLLAANPAQRQVLVFSAGVVLAVPAVDAAQAVVQPPWREVGA